MCLSVRFEHVTRPAERPEAAQRAGYANFGGEARRPGHPLRPVQQDERFSSDRHRSCPRRARMGVLFEIPEGALDLMDKIEGVRADGTGNYQRAHVEVTAVPDGGTVAAITYVGTESGRERFRKQFSECRVVEPDYFGHLLAGTRQFNFAIDYVRYLYRLARLPE